MVGYLIGYGVVSHLLPAVPAIQQTCVPLHRDVVVYLTGWHGPGYRRVATYVGAIGSQGCGIMYTATE